MNEVFIWLSGLRFIDNFFWIFTENKPVRGLRKKYNIPDVNWLSYFLWIRMYIKHPTCESLLRGVFYKKTIKMHSDLLVRIPVISHSS